MPWKGRAAPTDAETQVRPAGVPRIPEPMGAREGWEQKGQVVRFRSGERGQEGECRRESQGAEEKTVDGKPQGGTGVPEWVWGTQVAK